MKLPLPLSFYHYFLLLVLAITTPSVAQYNKKTWPSANDYKLQGKVKSWTMKNETGILRRQEFDKKGNLTSDTYKESEQTYTHPLYLPEKLKTEFEKVYKSKSELEGAKANLVFNDRMQLLEKQTPDYHEINKFTDQGKIIVNKTTEIITETRFWNSRHDIKPSYTSIDTLKFLVIYKYNKAGLLKEFEYYHSNIIKSHRNVYLYDKDNNLIEINLYGDSDIDKAITSDTYLNKFINTEIDTTFSINKFYSNFWKENNWPAKITWKYNKKGQKTEYVVGSADSPSFKATWEYDKKGKLLKEIHHDVRHGTLHSIIEFDKKGNVSKETDFDYWGKKEYRYSYEIVYY